ncbi:hypothetical protein Tco_0790222 [Tanacetum coccineum]
MGLVTPGMLSFPFPAEPFDVSLQSRLSRYPIEFRTFSEPVLYLAGLVCSWEGSPLHPAIMIDGQDFLQFLRNHPVSVVVVPTDAPLSAGSSNIVVVNILKETVEMQPADLGVGVFPPRAKRVSTAAHPALWGAMPAFAPVGLSSKGKV